MWARLAGWMIADGEPPLPAAGSVLSGVGLRVFGGVTTAPPESPEEISEVNGTSPQDMSYRLVGRVVNPRDVDVDFGRHTQHAGMEFVLVVGIGRFQVRAGGAARDLTAGSRVAVTGRLELVGAYEWDAFALDESRADWVVNEVVPVGDHEDVWLDLVLPASA